MFDFLKRKDNKSVTTAIEMMMPKIGRSNAQYSNIDLSNAYKKWVYACISRTADTVSSVPLELMSMSTGTTQKWLGKKINKSLRSYDKSFTSLLNYKLADNVEEVYAHPFLTLLENPNNTDSQKQFIYKIVTNLELFGDAYILVQQEGNLIVSLDCLHTQMITPDIDYANNETRGYWYMQTGGKPLYILPEDMCRISYYNPNDDYNGYSPLKSIMTPHELSLLYDDYNYAILNNSGNPSMVISYQGKALTQDERDKLETQWNKLMRGAANAGRVKVVGNDFIVNKLSMSNEEMCYIEGQREVRLSICNAFRVPLSLIDQKDSNRSSLDGAYYTYQKDKIRPTIGLICDSFNKNIISRYGDDNLWLSYQNPVELDRTNKLNEVILMKTNGLLTDEEAILAVSE